jgi:hypothetical protein
MTDVPKGTEFTLVMLLTCYRAAMTRGDSGWISAPDHALGELRTLRDTGHVECRDGVWRPTIKAQEALRQGVIK